MGGWGFQSGIGAAFDKMSNYFSPKATPSAGVLACQAAPSAAPASASAAAGKTAVPIPFNAAPCDVQQLKVTVPGLEGGDSEFTATQSLVCQMTPPAAPERLKGLFADFDLVLETVGPEAGRATSNAAVPSWHGDRERNDLGGPSRPTGQDGAKLVASAAWAASCSDPGHKALQYVPDAQAEATSGQQAVAAGATLNKFFYSRPLPGVSDIRNLISALLDSQRLVSEYHLVAGSCGRPAAGSAKGRLSAIVRAYPKGVIGLKFSIAPPGGKGDWSQALDAADRQAISADQARLEALSKRPGALPKGAGRAASAARKAATRSANRNRDALRAVGRNADKGLIAKNSGGKREIGWTINDGCTIEVSAIYADRELSFEDAKSLMETLQKIRAAADSMTSFIAFVRDFTPSLVQPTVGMSFKVMNGDILVGAAHYPVAKGTRFQAVEHEYFASIDLIVLGAEGSAGLIIGKMILGTGLDVTVLVSAGGQVSVKGEVTFVEGMYPWVEAKGEVSVGVSGIFRASVAYREIISASIEAKVGVDLTCKFKFREMKFEPVEWRLPAVVFVGNYRNAVSGAAETRRVEVSREREGTVVID